MGVANQNGSMGEAKAAATAVNLRTAFGTSAKVGFFITLLVTVLGMLASAVSLIATDSRWGEGTKQQMIIVGGVLSLVANAISSATGYYTPPPPRSTSAQPSEQTV